MSLKPKILWATWLTSKQTLHWHAWADAEQINAVLRLNLPSHSNCPCEVITKLHLVHTCNILLLLENSFPSFWCLPVPASCSITNGYHHAWGEQTFVPNIRNKQDFIFNLPTFTYSLSLCYHNWWNTTLRYWKHLVGLKLLKIMMTGLNPCFSLVFVATQVKRVCG